ncbi:MAG: hypothetical protein ACXQTR_01750 [Candidatus Methanospirareceae archaeon]
MWAWIKKNWVAVLAGLSALIGFITGYRIGHEPVRGSDELVKDLRSQIDGLTRKLGELTASNSELVGINNDQQERIKHIGIELENARKFVDEAKQDIASGRSTASELKEGFRGLNTILEKYRSELENIQIHD